MNEVQKYVLGRAMQKVASSMEKEAKTVGSHLWDALSEFDIPRYVGKHVSDAYNGVKKFFKLGDEAVQVGNDTVRGVELPGQTVQSALERGYQRAVAAAEDTSTIRIPKDPKKMGQITQQVVARQNRAKKLRDEYAQLFGKPVNQFFYPELLEIKGVEMTPNGPGNLRWSFALDDYNRLEKLHGPRIKK